MYNAGELGGGGDGWAMFLQGAGWKRENLETDPEVTGKEITILKNKIGFPKGYQK